MNEAIKEKKAKLEVEVNAETMDLWACLDHPDPQDPKVTRVTMETSVNLDPWVSPVLWAHQVRKVTQG